MFLAYKIMKSKGIPKQTKYNIENIKITILTNDIT